jgi:hypothetical protein
VFILSEITDFVSTLGDKTLRQLDWTDYNHTQSFSTLYQSWEASNQNSRGLFGGDILYPMIHYGYDYQTGDTTSFKFKINEGISGDGFTFSGSSVQPSYFKPSIRIKRVIENIFNNSGYKVNSEFFNTPYFKSIYMSLSNNGKIGVETASAQTNQNIFKTYTPQGQEVFYVNGQYQLLRFDRVNTTDGYNPSLQFDETTSVYRVPVSGSYSFEVKGKINQRYSNNVVPTYYGLVLYKANTLSDLLNRT